MTCYSSEEAIRVITNYLSLEDWFWSAYEALEEHPEDLEKPDKMVMQIPNNSILKGGEIR